MVNELPSTPSRRILQCFKLDHNCFSCRPRKNHNDITVNAFCFLAKEIEQCWQCHFWRYWFEPRPGFGCMCVTFPMYSIISIQFIHLTTKSALVTYKRRHHLRNASNDKYGRQFVINVKCQQHIPFPCHLPKPWIWDDYYSYQTRICTREFSD
jgi:hypothetical protein